MDANAPQPEADRFRVSPTEASHFAWLRTRLALERTMMAWVRTATALIGFGFTIVQFFERFNDMAGVDPAAHPLAARYIGLILIAAGVVALALSAVQYRATIRYLWHGDFAAIAGFGSKTARTTPAYVITIVLLFIGVFVFVAVLVRAV